MGETWSISEASRTSGISRNTIYRLLKDGRLRDFEVIKGSKRVLRVDGLVEFLRGGGVRPRVDSPWANWTRPGQQEADSDMEPVVSPFPESWPCGDDWERFANDWGHWRPDEELDDGRFWEEVAQLMNHWLIQPPPPITRATAPSYFLAITDAMAAVEAGFRFSETQWNRSAVVSLLAEPPSDACSDELRAMLDAGKVEDALRGRVEQALADYEASKMQEGIEQGK